MKGGEGVKGKGMTYRIPFMLDLRSFLLFMDGTRIPAVSQYKAVSSLLG